MQSTASNLVDAFFHIAGARAETGAILAGLPPVRYVGVLSPSCHVADKTLAAMKEEFDIFLAYEQACLQQSFMLDVQWLQDLLPRLIFLAYESSKFSRDSLQGQRLMRAAVQVLPDTKALSEAHDFPIQ